MNRRLQRLDSVHQKLIVTVSPLASEIFSARPSANEWSVGEIVQHLCLVEERVVKDLERAFAKEPRNVAFLRRLVPTFIVSSRLLRVKAPKAMNPINVPEKAAVIDNYIRARENLKALCATHGKDRFKHIVFKHPFLGEIDGLATVSFVGYHEHRHYKQIREVLKRISVGSSVTTAPN